MPGDLRIDEELGGDDAVVFDGAVIAAVTDPALPSSRGVIAVEKGRGTADLLRVGVLGPVETAGRIAEERKIKTVVGSREPADLSGVVVVSPGPLLKTKLGRREGLGRNARFSPGAVGVGRANRGARHAAMASDVVDI